MAPRVDLALLLDAFDAGVDQAAPLERRLQHAYHRELNRLVKQAARNFLRHAITASALDTHEPRATSLVAAAPAANWSLPDPDEILPQAHAIEQLTKATEPTRVQLVSKMMGDTLASVGVGFNIQNPLAQTVLGGMGKRITEISGFTRASIMASLQESFDKGLSIPHAAREMAKTVSATNVTRAKLIARTEFIGAQNASSLASVQWSGAAKFKVWLAALDSRTRPDHATANGQTVPVSQEFAVGGYPMQHPGDQNAPAREVCNCRCTMTYTDDPPDGFAEPHAVAPPVAADEPVPVLDAHTEALLTAQAKHPVGSTRNYYKKGNGYNLGAHEIVEHLDDGSIVAKDLATGDLKTVGAHELKKPQKAKLGGQAPDHVAADTSPLIPEAHAIPNPVKTIHQSVSEGEFPAGTVWKTDAGEIEVVGHTPGGNIEIHNKTHGGHSTITPNDASDLADEASELAFQKGVLPAGEESISAQGIPEPVVKQPVVTIGEYGVDPASVAKGQKYSFDHAVDVTNTSKVIPPGQGTVVRIKGDQVMLNAGTKAKPIWIQTTADRLKVYKTKTQIAKENTVKQSASYSKGDQLNVHGNHVTVESVKTDGNLIVKTQKGGTYTIRPSDVDELLAKSGADPVAIAKPSVDLSKPFTPVEGQTVKFDGGYDPQHPYGTPNAKALPGGEGIVGDVNYSTNQVMINTGTPDAPVWVQTHLSKMTNLDGQSAEWKTGGGKPNAPASYEQMTVDSSSPQEFLPLPKDNGPYLSSSSYREALGHDQTLLDRDAKAAVQEYTSSAYIALNKALRKGTRPALGKQLDRAFEQIPATTENGILHRYTNLRNVKSAQGIRPGQVIHDDGFVSTSTGQGTTSGFGADYLVIEVPKGAKVIDINAAARSNVGTEREVLLNRGARMLVTSVKELGGNRREIHVRLLIDEYRASPINPNE